jgi:hypothetical protein
VKSSGRDEPMWVVIHNCMETILGICMYLKLAKMLCLSISYVSSQLYQRTRGQNRFWLEAGEGEVGGVWPKQCIHM